MAPDLKRGPPVHFKRSNDRLAVAREALELQRIEQIRGAVKGTDAVRLQSYCADDNILLTEYIPHARSLFNELCNRSQWWRHLHSPAQWFGHLGLRIGRWLSCYHGTTVSSTQDYASLVGFLAESGSGKLLNVERAKSEWLSAATIQSVRQYLNDALEMSSSWGPQSVSQVHGDLDLSNILLAPPSRIVIVDFADSRRGFALEDVVRCWHSAWALSQILPRVHPFASALLEGYQLRETDLGAPLIKLLRCWNAVTFLLTAAVFEARFSFTMRRLLIRLAEVNRIWLESLVR